MSSTARLWVVLATCLAEPALAQRFAEGDIPVVRRRPRTMDVEHVALDVTIDIPSEHVSGTSTITGRTRGPRAAVELDAAELTISSVTVNGSVVTVREDGEVLVVPLPATLDGAVEIVVRYDATPKRGLYFMHADPAYPARLDQAWSQGEPDEARYWFPSYDAPDDRFSTEITAHVDPRFRTVANGRLVSDVVLDDRRTMHWKQEPRHVNYLISLVVGDFAEVDLGTWDGRVPALAYVPHGREDDARRAFARTTEMIGFMEDFAGRPYPWAKYAQTTVQDFLWAGMENTSATTLYTAVLYGDADASDVADDGTVLHELSHQWFGDLITCRSWRHLWLNEGFATYLEALWQERANGVAAGDFERHGSRAWYLGETYRRRLDEPRYENPDDLFDGHTYAKGAAVLHMLRSQLGDAVFRAAVRRYVKDHADGVVVTDDLRRAFEAESGQELESFFAEWVERGGHAKVSATWSYDASKKVLTVSAEQLTRPYFTLSLPVVATGSFGTASTRLDLADKRASVSLPLAAAPDFVEIDRDESWLMELRTAPGAKELTAQLRRSPSALSRAAAAEKLSALTLSGPIAAGVVAALADATQPRPDDAVGAVRQVRRAAIMALASRGGPTAERAILGMLADSDSRLRAAAAVALGSFATPAARKALVKAFNVDVSAAVAAAALTACVANDVPNVRSLIARALERDSHEDGIRVAAVSALEALGGSESADALLALTRWGEPTVVRQHAVEALGRLGTDDRALSKVLRPRFEELLSDPRTQVMLAAVEALGELRDPACVPALTALRPKARYSRDLELALAEALSNLKPVETPHPR